MIFWELLRDLEVYYARIDELADKAQASFHRRFWYGRGGHLQEIEGGFGKGRAAAAARPD